MSETPTQLEEAREAVRQIAEAFQGAFSTFAERMGGLIMAIRHIQHAVDGEHICKWREAGNFDVCAHGYVVRASGKPVMHNGRKPRR